MSTDTAEADDLAFAFKPIPGRTWWWRGDPASLDLHEPGEHHRYFLTRRAALSPEQCRILIDCFERNREDNAAQNVGEYWDGRFIWQNNIPETEIDALRVMQQARFLALTLLCQAVRPQEALYSDTAQIVRWHEGLELPPHVDNMEPDGRPNTSPHRSYSSIIYLNDDYEGGETFFPGHGIRLKPETGALVVFGAGPEYVHGVTRVRKGLRYTYAGWFTHDKTKEDSAAARVF